MNRNELIKELKLSGVGLELGVAQGDFSNTLLSHSDMYLYLIDAWRHFTIGYEDGCNLPDEIQLLRMSLAVAKLRRFENRFTLIRDLSERACDLFSDNFFDFIYLDANHHYDYIKKDLDLWYPKLKYGGIFAGHDYVDRPPQFGVKQAVDEFALLHHLDIQTTNENTSDGPWLTWYTIKT